MECSGFRIAEPPTLADERLRSLYEYWHALGLEAGGLPPVQAFDPLRLPKLLANLWILEVAPDTPRFRMRLAGENINAVYRRTIAGHYLDEIFAPSELDLVVARYTRALREPAIMHAAGAVYAAAGSYSHGERLGLPMLGRSGFTDTVLGATVYEERLAAAGPVRIFDSEPAFHPVSAANHRPPPRIEGG
jgi:hypothetical protein